MLPTGYLFFVDKLIGQSSGRIQVKSLYFDQTNNLGISSMLCFPNAKINIGLNVISKRSDGFHDIETVFCPVGLSDILEFVPMPGLPPGNCTFTLTGIPVKGPSEENLCVRAYHLLSRDFQLPAVDIHLHKIIPMGSGLGGGSSDGAFMLKQLNVQFNLYLNDDQLCTFASQLGSDCAFFIRNRILFAFERGDRFREIPVIPGNFDIVIVNPGIHIGTSEAYSGIRPGKPAHELQELIALPMTHWRDAIKNDFEETVFRKFPVVGEIKSKLYQMGAIYASMSGSGSSVYGLFAGKAPKFDKEFPGFFCWSGPLQ
jgi:4-diphosphocytidyl-2-C-methyl-D-erythritol kinase